MIFLLLFRTKVSSTKSKLINYFEMIIGTVPMILILCLNLVEVEVKNKNLRANFRKVTGVSHQVQADSSFFLCHFLL